jgi:PhnB protein
MSNRIISAVFITFSGNCKKALTFYQRLFGGRLQFETFGGELAGYAEIPIVSGSLISDRIVIHGSDLVHDEGRRIGNYISVFLQCRDAGERGDLLKKLEFQRKPAVFENSGDQKLVEVVDGFDVRWILGV